MSQKLFQLIIIKNDPLWENVSKVLFVGSLNQPISHSSGLGNHNVGACLALCSRSRDSSCLLATSLRWTVDRHRLRFGSMFVQSFLVSAAPHSPVFTGSWAYSPV